MTHLTPADDDVRTIVNILRGRAPRNRFNEEQIAQLRAAIDEVEAEPEEADRKARERKGGEAVEGIDAGQPKGTADRQLARAQGKEYAPARPGSSDDSGKPEGGGQPPPSTAAADRVQRHGS